jgi:hypothetical protein
VKLVLSQVHYFHSKIEKVRDFPSTSRKFNSRWVVVIHSVAPSVVHRTCTM